MRPTAGNRGSWPGGACFVGGCLRRLWAVAGWAGRRRWSTKSAAASKVIAPYIALPRAMAMGGVHGFWANLEADCRLVLARLANRCRSIQPACLVGWRSCPERWFPAGVYRREAYQEAKPLRYVVASDPLRVSTHRR